MTESNPGWKPDSVDDMGSHVRGGYTEAYARARAARLPGRSVVRREVGPWRVVSE